MDNNTSMFSADKKLLSEIIRSISNGSCQLPDFQRPWVWDNNRIIKLLSSVCQSHPIGSIMLYSSGHPDVRFKPKPIEGAPEMKIIPEHFILDGQQRLTALYQTLMTQKPVRTRDENNKEIHRWYYLDINSILEENLDIEDCIYSLPEDKIQRGFGKDIIIRDYSNRDLEFKNLVFPLSEYSNWDDWRDKFQEYWGYDKEKSKLINLFGKKVIQTFTTYQLPAFIPLKKSEKMPINSTVNTSTIS